MPELSPSIRHLRDLVAIPSVNPMGRDDLPGEIVGEHAVAEHLSEKLRRLGLDAALMGEGGRTSVVAEAVAGPDAETLMVASHIDTVPIDGMEIAPFDPVVEGGAVLGRGSCDTKAGMAACGDMACRASASVRPARSTARREGSRARAPPFRANLTI